MRAPATPAAATASDADLVRAYLGGDEGGATALVGRHAAGVARFLAASGADPGELDDLLQETFIRAFRALGTWRGESGLRSWLLSIAGNLARDYHRRVRNRTVVTLEETDLITHEGPAERFDAREAERRMQEGLGTLPRLQREVFLLRAQQGFDYDEIARTLETTPGSARVHYHHAVKRLKELMA
jgi:RNA polymerase sigma-70 factor (ECF subfamily)